MLFVSLIQTVPAYAHTDPTNPVWSGGAVTRCGTAGTLVNPRFGIFDGSYKADLGPSSFPSCDFSYDRVLFQIKSFNTSNESTSAWVTVAALGCFCDKPWHWTAPQGNYEVAEPALNDAHYWRFRFTDEVGGCCGLEPGSSVYATGATSAEFEPPAAPTNLRLVSTSPGGKLLTYDMVAALGFLNGWTSEQALTEMVAVTRAESGFRTKAISYIGCCHGLMQIHTGVHPYTPEQMYDPDQNVAAGRIIYTDASGWDPWEAYTGPDGSGSDGPWLQYESYARAAAKRQIECGGCAHGSIASAPNSGNGSVLLAWDTTCVDCDYELQRKGSSYSTIGTTENLAFSDNQAADGASYTYRVRGENGNGVSDWSNELPVTTGEANPSAGGIVDGNPEDGGTDEDGSNTGAGTKCWSINPITVIKCALRWAFMPGEATSSAWESFYDNLSTRPPFSVAFGVGSFILDMVDEIKAAYDVGTANGYDCVDFTVPELGENTACFAGPLGDLATEQATLVGAMRTGFNVFLLAGTVWMVWRILKTAFSSAPEVEDKEQLRHNDGGEKEGDEK